MKRIATGLFICVVAVAQANAQDCYQSSIVSPSPFMGNNGEIIKLSDGSLWEVKYEYEYLYEYFPTVVICPGQGKLIVGRTSLNVQLVSSVPDAVTSARRGPGQAGKWDMFEETQLEGTISGTVQQGRIFRTTSGNVYEVTGLTLQLVLEVQPEVMVLRNGDTYRLVVEGFDEPLLCRKLNGGPAASGVPDAVTSARRGPGQAGRWDLFEETQLEGTISGTVQQGRIFRTTSGNVYEVTGLTLQLVLEVQPEVMVLRNGDTYRLVVEGFDEPLLCRKLNGGPAASGVPDAVTSARRGPGQAGRWDLFEETQLEGTISGTVQQGRIFRTTSGNVYEVTGLTLQLVLEIQPEVMVLRNGDTYRLVVEGFDEPLLCRKLNGGPAAQRRGVAPIPSVIETQVDGEFNGWEGETIVKLTNGQVWRQSEYHYFYHYAYRPKVVVYRSGGGYKMQVEGVDQAVGVESLR